MSTASWVRPLDRGSGGKIIRQRHRKSPASSAPYRRPDPPVPSIELRNPNWFFALLAPASRLVTGSAGRLFSSVLGRNDSQSSSSSSGSTSSQDEDDAEREALSLVPQESNEAIKQRSEAKITIERLLYQETFSRDEYVRLTKILQSRLIDDATPREKGAIFRKDPHDSPRNGGVASMEKNHLPESNKRPAEEWEKKFVSSPGLAGLTATTPDLCITAVMEAKKWRQTRKLKSISSPHSTRAPDTPKNIAEGDIGSPVDIAKSYMQARPLRASSPSIGCGSLHTPLSSGSFLLSDETPIALACQSAPFCKEKNSVATDIFGNLTNSQCTQQKLAEESVRVSADLKNIISSPSSLENNVTERLPCDLETNCQPFFCDLKNTNQQSSDADEKLTEDAHLNFATVELAADACDKPDGLVKHRGIPAGHVDGKERIGAKLVGDNYYEKTNNMIATSQLRQIVEMKKPVDSHSAYEPVSEGPMRLQHVGHHLHQDCEDLREEAGRSQPAVDVIANEEISDNGFKPSLLISARADEGATHRGPVVGNSGPINSNNGTPVIEDAMLNHRVGQIPIDYDAGPTGAQPKNDVKLEGKSKARKRVKQGTSPKRTGIATASRGRGKKSRPRNDGKAPGLVQEAWK